jgi:hypothetical protein
LTSIQFMIIQILQNQFLLELDLVKILGPFILIFFNMIFIMYYIFVKKINKKSILTSTTYLVDLWLSLNLQILTKFVFYKPNFKQSNHISSYLLFTRLWPVWCTGYL